MIGALIVYFAGIVLIAAGTSDEDNEAIARLGFPMVVSCMLLWPVFAFCFVVYLLSGRNVEDLGK